jgi:protein-L-isoaspartate(D-aspartate) O-methyltransferase
MSGSVVDYYAKARQHMVKEHLQRRDIKDRRVLDVMGRIPRELFVPAFLRNYAYDDRPLLIGHEQTISQPYIVALMTEALQLQGAERVLEIGTGSGYQTAVLAELADQVCTIERIAKLSLRARGVLEELGYSNIHFKVANGTLGWPEEAPFDAILVTAGATSLPRSYHAQLREGGRLVIPLGPIGGQVLHRYTRRGDDWDDEELARVAFVPLIRD